MEEHPTRVVVIAPSANVADVWRARVPGSTAVVFDAAAHAAGQRATAARPLVEADVILAIGETSQRWIVEAAHQVRAPAPPVILIRADLNQAAASTRGRVAGVLPPDIPTPQLLAAIDAVRAGLSVSVPASDARTEDADAPGWDATLLEPEPLTARELQVLALLASGARNRAIAARLDISEHTVKFHVASILGKLGVATRTQAVHEGLRRGLISI